MTRIIYITSRPIGYPGGDATRAISMIKLLALKYSEVLVLENRAKVDVLPGVRALNHSLPQNVQIVSYGQTTLDLCRGFVRYIFGTLPLSVCVYYNQRIRNYVLEHEGVNIHVHLAKSLIYIPTKLYAEVFFDYCDLESKKISKLDTLSLKSLFFKSDLARYRNLENRLQLFRRIYLINPKEKDLVNEKNVIAIQNFRFEKEHSLLRSDVVLDEILLIGNFKTISNRQALDEFLREVWPDVRSSYFLKIAGLITGDIRVKLEKDKKIKLLGVYDRIDTIVNAHSVILVPNAMGGGIQNKLLDGLYTGVITVARKEVLSGLDLSPDSVISYSSNDDLISLLNGLKNEKEFDIDYRRKMLLIEAKKIDNMQQDALKWL